MHLLTIAAMLPVLASYSDQGGPRFDTLTAIEIALTPLGVVALCEAGCSRSSRSSPHSGWRRRPSPAA